MQTLPFHPRLFFGYEYPVTNTQKGRIYLDGKVFANFWTIKGWTPELDGLVTLNRDSLALDMNFPAQNNFKSLAELQETISEWLEKNNK